MEHEQSTGTHSMMHSEPMPEIWGLLTEEQKKKVAVMRMDMIIQLMEIKSAQTFHPDYLKNITYYQKLNQGKYTTRPFVIYAGDSAQQRESFTLLPWTSEMF